MKKNCVYCKFSLSEEAKFCAKCGEKQPDLSQENQKAEYSATIGDKNVISGNIIGKSEEINIAGHATINKIEDETKKFITCAVSGKHLLRGRDAVVNCPKCKSDVSLDYFTQLAGRCFNCDKVAYTQFSNQLDIILSDGIIDAAERIQLDAFALSLMIDNSTKLKLETEAKERKANINLNAINDNSNELSGFYKIQFKKAVTLLFEQNDLASALNILKTVHLENIYHDETSSLYFLVKAIHSPQEFIDTYENDNQRQIDIYWEHFWAFIAYSELQKYDQAFKIINLNKARFSDNRNDILLSLVIAYLMQFFATKESEWLDEAKSVYTEFGRTIKQPLVAIHELINKLIITPVAELNALSKDFSTHEKFYFDFVIEHKSSKKSLIGEKNIQSHKSENQNEAINEHIEVAGKKWLKKTLKTTTFRNGVEIPIAKSIDEWMNFCRAKKAVMCYYNFNDENHALYNYYAILSVNGLAPEGYSIPKFEIDTIKVDDIILSPLVNLGLPSGILMAGRDMKIGKFKKEFSEKIYLATLDLFEDADDDEPFEEMAGLWVIDINKTQTELTNENGLWGLQVLLVKDEGNNLINESFNSLSLSNNSNLERLTSNDLKAEISTQKLFLEKNGGKIIVEIADEDFDSELTWPEAKKACASLGSGWRLPDEHELELIHKNYFSNKLGNFKATTYWSSSKFMSDLAFACTFSSSCRVKSFKESVMFKVRAVKELS